jgi:hypothetical protein
MEPKRPGPLGVGGGLLDPSQPPRLESASKRGPGPLGGDSAEADGGWRPQPIVRTLIVIGSPTPNQTFQWQFATAAECLGGGLETTWLVEKTGYEALGVSLDYVRLRAPAGGYGWITPEEDLVAWINHMPDHSIDRLFVFSHGLVGIVTLRHGWESVGLRDYGLSVADVERIDPNKFAPDAMFEFDSCNSATETDFGSVAQAFADRTRHATTAWTGRTSYYGVNRGTCTVVGSGITGRGNWELVTEVLSRMKGRTPHKVTLQPR